MSKLKEIGNKLFKEEKVELSMEVKLGSIKDWESDFDKANDKDLSTGGALIDAVSRAEGKYKQVKSMYENLIKESKKIEDSAKDLGVDLPATFKNKVLSAKEGVKEMNSYLSALKKMYSLF